jgi:hypothetical protein
VVTEANEMNLIEGTMSTLVLFLVLVSWIVALLVAYWVIRLAVRHALRDAGPASPPVEGGPADR